MTIEPLTIVLLAVTALFAGIVDAIAGGGGLITLPALLTAGVPPQLAFGTNKGQSVWGSGAALIAFWRAGRVDRRQALFAFPLAFAGSAIGARAVLLIDKDALKPLVIAMLIGAAGLLMIKKPSRDVDGRDPARPAAPPEGGAESIDLPPTPRTHAIALVLAFVIGAYDGFFGPGTGTFLIVGFVALCGRSMTRATADAKVVNFASNLAALATFAQAGSVIWKISLAMAVGQLAGGVIGARLAIKGGARLIRVLVLLVSGALVIKLGYELIR